MSGFRGIDAVLTHSSGRLRRLFLLVLMACGLGVLSFGSGSAQMKSEDDIKKVGDLDRTFQRAVKENDAEVMDQIFHQNMILVLGDGRVQTRQEQLDEARSKTLHYEIQDEDPGTQTVRVYGDTAVVTAKLRIKGTRSDGSRFDRHLWFSDTYVRTAQGWKYFFGQASTHIPDTFSR
jgi:ketosteroid isomerase-like protein